MKKTDVNQVEELSRCLDDLNNGSSSVPQDEEIKELVELASLVKQSYSQKDLPQLTIDEIVDTLADEFWAQQQKRRAHWWYGGLVGTAAAVLLVVSVQLFLPQSPDSNIVLQEQLPNNIETQNFVALADKANDSVISQSRNTSVVQQVQASEGTEQVSGVIVDHSANSVAIQKPNQVAMLQQRKIPGDTTMQKSALMTKTTTGFSQENPNSQIERRSAMRVLPNQIAQSITVDNSSGVIRQVYNQGTKDEIIITQSLVGESMTKAQGDANQATKQESRDVMNSLTVKADNYYITIEGKKPKDELLKIAQSLVVKYSEQ